MASYIPEETATMRSAAADRDANIKMTEVAAKGDIDKIGAEADAQIKLMESGAVTKMDGDAATKALKDGVISQSILDAYNTEYGTSFTIDNPPPIYVAAMKDMAPDPYSIEINGIDYKFEGESQEELDNIENWINYLTDQDVEGGGNPIYLPIQRIRDNYETLVEVLGRDKLKEIARNYAELVAQAEYDAGHGSGKYKLWDDKNYDDVNNVFDKWGLSEFKYKDKNDYKNTKQGEKE